MLPIDCIARSVGETFELTHRFSQHLRFILPVDDAVVPFIFIQQRWCKHEVTEPSSTLPSDSLCHSTLINCIDDSPQTWNDVRVAMLSQLDHNPAATHFMGYRAGGARAGKGVQHPVTRLGSHSDNPLNK